MEIMVDKPGYIEEVVKIVKDVERKYLNEIKGAIACSLGPRVYRAETAALVALAMAQVK